MKILTILLLFVVFTVMGFIVAFADDEPSGSEPELTVQSPAPSGFEPSRPYPIAKETISPPQASLPKGLESIHVELPIPRPLNFIEDSIENLISIASGVALVNCGRQAKIYDIAYAPGKYRTTVNVFEGRVFVCPYDEYGKKEEDGIMLASGQKLSRESVIR